MSVYSLMCLLMFVYTSPVKGSTPISSGFGDFRRKDNLHFHNAVDIGRTNKTPVYYPEDNDTTYKPKVSMVTYFGNASTCWKNQSHYLIIGRFCFTHLNTKRTPLDTVLKTLSVPKESARTWLQLWQYCKNHNIHYKKGLQVGVIGKPSCKHAGAHLHFGELLIPNKEREGIINIQYNFYYNFCRNNEQIIQETVFSSNYNPLNDKPLQIVHRLT